MNRAKKAKSVLIVDDEKSFLLSLSQGLASYDRLFRTLTAVNGRLAVEILEAQEVDLVITDLRMPELDGFGLLAYLSEKRPLIPVIVMSAFCTPEIRSRLEGFGSIRIVEKPIDFKDFVNQILVELSSESRGFVHGISLPAFLQLIEMEKKTCTIRVVTRDRIGFLYFQEGRLIDAENGADEHEKAALDIASWTDPLIEIDGICRKKESFIQASLEYIILEGSRLMDERLKSPGRKGSAAAAAAAPRSGGEGREKLPVENAGAAGLAAKEDNMGTTKESLGELADMPSVEAVCLVARDGFLVDSHARTGIDREMVSAIASSGFGASTTMGTQLEKGALQISMIEFEKGPVLFSPVGEEAFLVIVAGKEANLGLIRLQMKKHAHELVRAAAV